MPRSGFGFRGKTGLHSEGCNTTLVKILPRLVQIEARPPFLNDLNEISWSDWIKSWSDLKSEYLKADPLLNQPFFNPDKRQQGCASGPLTSDLMFHDDVDETSELDLFPTMTKPQLHL